MEELLRVSVRFMFSLAIGLTTSKFGKCCRLFAASLPLITKTIKVGDVIAKSDYILVSAALTPETIGLVGAEQLARVRD